MNKATELFEQIQQTQETLRAEEDAKRDLEQQLAVVNQSIMTAITTLGDLQDQLDKALHHASVEATEGEDGETSHG